MDPVPSADVRARERFEALVMPLAPAVYRLALRLTRRAEDAADLAQETLLRAYRTFAAFVPGTNARAWLFTILWSIASNERQRRARSRATISIEELEERYERALDVPDRRDLLGTLDRLDWRSSEVGKALDLLPEEFRMAVLLVDVEGLTYEEAAAASGCPAGTLRSRPFRGRRALAVSLHEYALETGFVKRESRG